MRDEWSDEIALEGYTAGFTALARDGLPDAAAFTRYLFDNQAELFPRETEDEIDIAAVMARSFREHGVDLTDDDVRLFLQAAQGVWSGYYLLADSTHALLDALRARGLKLALVSNTASPEWLLQPILERQGISQRVDTVALSSEVGKRKPHRAIFERALGELEVNAEDALFVGDRLDADVYGASRLGMKTVQALWFRADDAPVDVEPDYQAFTLMDVLNVAGRLAA
jgi:HAD superfamily hydrolase (TIGR01549 family)